jgi:hypothetical protein
MRQNTLMKFAVKYTVKTDIRYYIYIVSIANVPIITILVQYFTITKNRRFILLKYNNINKWIKIDKHIWNKYIYLYNKE